MGAGEHNKAPAPIVHKPCLIRVIDGARSMYSYIAVHRIYRGVPAFDDYYERFKQWVEVEERAFMSIKKEEKPEMSQRQYTMELRVDFVDPAMNEKIKKAFLRSMRHVYAEAALAAQAFGGAKPQIAAWSDDWFHGHEDIKMTEDVIAKGIEEIGDPEETKISQELLDAASNS